MSIKVILKNNVDSSPFLLLTPGPPLSIFLPSKKGIYFKIMDYQRALNYILSFADFERWPGAGYAERWDLRRMEEILKHMDSPHTGIRTVHVAGSKGKGSIAAMISSGLIAEGFRTGMYTSPHLHSMRERVRINGELISENDFAQITARMKPCIEEVNKGPYGVLSTFELLTALALTYFKEQGAEFNVLETGLGGRLDATNICQPEVCVISSISLDHTAVLGDTIARIAGEKAGIIKSGVTVVSSPQIFEAADVIKSVCLQKGARLISVGDDVKWAMSGFSYGRQSFEISGLNGNYEVMIPLLGEHQLENAVAAVTSLEVLGINRDCIVSGLAKTQWSGRLEILRDDPLFIADGAHSSDSARRLSESLKQYFQFNRAILILGTSADKNTSGIVRELALFFDIVITTTSKHPRASKAKELADEFAGHNVDAMAVEDVSQAVAEALMHAEKDDLICATGSLFLVAEVIEEVKGFSGERYPDE